MFDIRGDRIERTRPSVALGTTEHIQIIITSAQEVDNVIRTQVWAKPLCGAIHG